MYFATLVNVNGQFSVSLWRAVGGVWTLLGSNDVNAGVGELRLDTVGSSQNLYFDGQLMVSANDGAISGPGAVGVRGRGGSFDDFSVSLPGMIGSDQSLAEYLTQRIYAPLGMSDSSNHESVADNSRMSAVFTRGRRGGALRARWSPGDTPDYPFVRASGGMISTAPDYVIFCQMFLNGGTYGGTRILSEASVRAANHL